MENRTLEEAQERIGHMLELAADEMEKIDRWATAHFGHHHGNARKIRDLSEEICLILIGLDNDLAEEGTHGAPDPSKGD